MDFGDPWTPTGWLCRRCGMFWQMIRPGLYVVRRKPEDVCAASLHDIVSARIVEGKSA